MTSIKFDTLSTPFKTITLSKNDFERFIRVCQSDTAPGAALKDAVNYSKLCLFSISQPVLQEDGLTGLPGKPSSCKTGQQA